MTSLAALSSALAPVTRAVHDALTPVLARVLSVEPERVDLSQEAIATLTKIYLKLVVLGMCICLARNVFAVVRKLVMYGKGVLYLLFCKDTKFKPMSDPEGVEITERRRIIFIRHAESLWNDTFNRTFNPIFFIPRLIKALATEGYLLVAGFPDSWFFDSPLSPFGRTQAQELADFLRTVNPASLSREAAAAVDVLRAAPGAEPSQILVSPLRRCLTTLAIGLQQRLAATREKMLVLSELQEISRNVDTLSLTRTGSSPTTPWRELADPAGVADVYGAQLDASKYKGNKKIRSTGLERLLGLCDVMFKSDKRTFVIGGHSLYLREFFKCFCRRTFDHDGKNTKLENAGVLLFTVGKGKRSDGRPVYCVLDAEPIVNVFKTFEKATKKKKSE